MLVKNKQESDFYIRKLGLNRMSDGIFTNKDTDKLIKFLDNNPHKYYNMRDKNKSSSTFLYKITRDEVLQNAPTYELFSVYESLAEADEKLVLQGDICIDSDFDILASLDTRKGISNRIAMQNPQYTINTKNIKKSKPHIKGLNSVVDYIYTNELFNMVVEFSLFDIPVGINQEKIIIWELRNY